MRFLLFFLAILWCSASFAVEPEDIRLVGMDRVGINVAIAVEIAQCHCHRFPHPEGLTIGDAVNGCPNDTCFCRCNSYILAITSTIRK